MFEIKKTLKFEAAHWIEGHIDPVTGGPGKCSNMHGHSYEVSVCIHSPGLLPIGFVLDYYWLGIAMKTLVDRWDHQVLNDVPDFQNRLISTTAENIAFVLFMEVEHFLSQTLTSSSMYINAYVAYAECKETAGTSARYYDPRRFQAV